MEEGHPLIIRLKTILEKSVCHRCADSLKLVKADCSKECIKAVVYCDTCNELSNATFIKN